MRLAFNLSEILITLSIIGIVAAITIPNVVKNYQKHVTVNLMKKTYFDVQEVIKHSTAENGELNTWEFPTQISDYNLFLNKYIKPYIKVSKKDSGWGQPKYVPRTMGGNKPFPFESYFYLSDGRILLFHKGVNYFWVAFDINGEKAPNVYGKDVFVLDLIGYYRHKKDSTADGRVDFWGDSTDINNIKNNYQYGCSKNFNGDYNGFFCGAWIKLNNWQIPDDYPW